MKLTFDKYRGYLSDVLMETFKIKFDSDAHEWQVYEPTRDADEEFKLIVEFYGKQDYTNEGIAKMLGMGRSSFFKQKKKC